MQAGGSPGLEARKETHLHRTHPSSHSLKIRTTHLPVLPKLGQSFQQLHRGDPIRYLPAQPQPTLVPPAYSPDWPAKAFPRALRALGLFIRISAVLQGTGQCRVSQLPCSLLGWGLGSGQPLPLIGSVTWGKSHTLPGLSFPNHKIGRITLALSASQKWRLEDLGAPWGEGRMTAQWFLPASAIVRHTHTYTDTPLLQFHVSLSMDSFSLQRNCFLSS